MKDGELITYRCHVGHGFSQEGLLSGMSDSMKTALWTALRLMEKKAEYTRRLADYAQKRNYTQAVWRYTVQAE